jgi:hypothetical protein
MNTLERSVLGRFSAEVQKAYGARVLGLYAFDYLLKESGEDEEISVDVDVAVVLADGEWTLLEEKKRLIEITFDVLLETEVYIRAWPLPISAWRNPSTYANPELIRDIKQHSDPVMEAV